MSSATATRGSLKVLWLSRCEHCPELGVPSDRQDQSSWRTSSSKLLCWMDPPAAPANGGSTINTLQARAVSIPWDSAWHSWTCCWAPSTPQEGAVSAGAHTKNPSWGTQRHLHLPFCPQPPAGTGILGVPPRRFTDVPKSFFVYNELKVTASWLHF